MVGAAEGKRHSTRRGHEAAGPGVKQIEWTESSLDDMAVLDKALALRISHAVERLAQTGAGNVKRLQGIDPPEYRLRVGDYRVRFLLPKDMLVVLRVRHRREAYR